MSAILRIAVASVASFLLAMNVAHAGKEKSLYDFVGLNGDGASPKGDLISDSRGNVYGTTFAGGPGSGTVFRISPKGHETILYSFNGRPDGWQPDAGLLMDGMGNLYGTTSSYGPASYGTAFELTHRGRFKLLHAFAGGNDGSYPLGALVMDAAGDLYGTTEYGGAHNAGTVFKITPTGHETILYSFVSGTDGAIPYAGLVFGPDGALYGTTKLGGSDCQCGTVFKIDMDGTESVLHVFTGGDDGDGPQAQLVADSSGILYGTTQGGGSDCDCGTLFSITISGTEKILHVFDNRSGPDGVSPLGRLLLGGSGEIYGTTVGGGSYDAGTVFELTATGREKLLYSFTGGEDGNQPQAGLTETGAGLIGTTFQGGAYEEGNAFRLKIR